MVLLPIYLIQPMRICLLQFHMYNHYREYLLTYILYLHEHVYGFYTLLHTEPATKVS